MGVPYGLALAHATDAGGAVLDRAASTREIHSMVVGKHLLEILRCPESRGELIFFDAGTAGEEPFLFCPASRLRYRIDDGIPVMLVEDALRLDEEQSAELMARAAELGIPVPASDEASPG
jgi:uncharacterized protein YbaR (Trm112 family)